MVAIEELRERGLMGGIFPLCLGGGHGTRAYLPSDLQRFSIDLDFYSGVHDVHQIIKKIEVIQGFKLVGYGLETEGRFKKFDSLPPANIKKCTLAFAREYRQAFKHGEVEPKFYVTVSNTSSIATWESKKPKSYIGIDYVKQPVPVLSPIALVTGKILALPTRKTKDVYKDVFDIYALFNWGDTEVDEGKLEEELSKTGSKIGEKDIQKKFKVTSNEANARSAIKLPSESRKRYLADWKSINIFVRNKTLKLLTDSDVLVRF